MDGGTQEVFRHRPVPAPDVHLRLCHERHQRVASPRGNRKEQNAGNDTDTTTAAEKKTKEETGKVELTDAQKEIIKGYDTDAKELIDTLSSSVWSVSEGRYTLKFADDSYVETVNGTPTVHSYAISRVEKTSDGTAVISIPSSSRPIPAPIS